jgi:hypothetical protein
MKLRAYLLMFCVVAVWGSTFVLIKGALVDATPAAFNLVRMTLAFALLAVAYHRSWRGIRRSHLAAGALVAISSRPPAWRAPHLRNLPSSQDWSSCWCRSSRPSLRCVRRERGHHAGMLTPAPRWLSLESCC